MIIPAGTDAPLKYRPWGTGLVVIACVALYIFSEIDPEAAAPLILRYGAFNPLTWITSAFLHAGIAHLLFNMVFLVVFGLVVEGQIGIGRFLAVYLGIAFVQGGIEQLLTIGWDRGGSLGASGAIFGLMALAMVWLPRRHILIYFWFLYGARHVHGPFPVRIQNIVGGYVAINFLLALIFGFGLSTFTLHLLGGGVGLAAGIYMLKKKLVDLDGEDWFSLREKDRANERAYFERQRRSSTSSNPWDAHAEEPTAVSERTEPSEPVAPADPLKAALARVRKDLESEDGVAAALVYEQERRALPEWVLPQDDLLRLINLNLECQDYARADPLMAHFIEAYPADAAEMQLQLAGIQIARRRPTPALETLGGLDDSDLSEAQTERRAKLAAQAQQLIDDGVLELD
ncbi:MAG: rhomboid family intramembrane serine protease [Planctomycetota bacterium]|nr:rhomboid family intramembrane serine protease [Planctomycetota bacterium]